MPTAAEAASTVEMRSLRRPLRVRVSEVVLMMDPLRIRSGRLPGGRFFEAAAESADEIDGQVELAVAQVGLEILLLEHLSLRREHLEVVSEACAVARDRDVVGFLGGGEPGARLCALRA